MQAHSLEVFFLAKIVFYPKNFFTILYCCLLIIASIITMFSFQGAFLSSSFKKLKDTTFSVASVNLLNDGGEYRDRTGDLLLARQALSQLSEPPIQRGLLEVVGQNGLEPSTSRLSVVCSSQLSYWPIFSFHIFFRYIFFCTL